MIIIVAVALVASCARFFQTVPQLPYVEPQEPLGPMTPTFKA